MATKQQCTINGAVAHGFESVRQLYERNMHTLAEEHSQLCIYYRGEKVVDLCASACAPGDFSADTLVNVFSSGKSLESIALAALVDKGLLRFDARITDYWPEFGAHGKADLTIADLMRHEAGLAAFNVAIDPQDLQTDNIKQNKVGRIIAEQPLKYAGDGTHRREYHAVTRGWVVNEIFRRVDPQGRTLGEFYREDINVPLDVEVLVGAREEELPRIQKVHHRGFAFEFLASLRPKFLGRRVVNGFFKLVGRLLRIIPAARKGASRGAPPPYKGMDSIMFFNERVVALGETPSANTKSSARTLAKLAAVMSARGKFSGREYLGETAWSALHADPVEAVMGGVIPTRFTQGGVNKFTPPTAGSSRLERDFNCGREGFYGWMGLGGSVFQWHPELDIGFAFVITELHVLDLLNERGKAYQEEVLRCVAALEQ